MVYHYKFGIIVPFFKKNFRQLILIVAAFFMLSIGLSGMLARAVTPPNWTIGAGTEVTYVCGGQNYVHTFDSVTPGVDGAFTGTGHYNVDGNYTWDASGTIAGDVLTFTITYTGTQSGSVYNATNGMIAGDGSVAGAVDGGCQTFSMSAGSLDPISAMTETEVDVYGSTTATENDAQKWLFNRDPVNATPIMFTASESKTGNGSLYVKPLSSVAAQKFIGEYFAKTPIADVTSFSYDFKAGTGADPVADANEFYLNVYANYGSSSADKYYDCKYDVVPTTSSGWTTVTFDPTMSYPVTTRTGGEASAFTCPSVPAEMNDQAAGSTIRMFAINLGDTSDGDQGRDGYFDNVVFTTTSQKTTYDFEPVTGTITNPAADGDVVSGTVNLTALYEDGDDLNDNAVQWAVRSGTCSVGVGTVLGNVDSRNDAFIWDGKNFSASFDTTTVPNGNYCFVFNPTDSVDQVDVRLTRTFTVQNVAADTTKPEVTINDPTSGEVLSGVVQVFGTIVDENPKDHRVRVFDDTSDRVYNGAWTTDDGLNNQLADSFDSSDYPDGNYRIRLIARDESDNRRGRNVWVVFDNYVDKKDECKNGGWTRGTFDGNQFKNQGQCVSFFESNKHKKPYSSHKKGHVLSRVKHFSSWCRRGR